MKLRTVLILLVVGLLAWGTLKLLGEPKKVDASRPPLVQEQLLSDWDEIELKLFSGEQLKLVREPGAIAVRFGNDKDPYCWRDAADREHMEQLMRALHSSWREPLLGDADDELRAGLASPRYRVRIRGGGQELDLGFGNDDPAGQGILAESFTQNAIFRTSRDVANLLEANRDEWRSKTIFGFDQDVVTQIDLVRFPEKSGAAPELLVAAREGPRTWRLQQPRSLVADPQACRSLAHLCSLLKVEEFLLNDWPDQLRKMTSLPDLPRMAITLSSGPSVQRLEIGDYIASRGYAARLLERDPDMTFTLKKEDVDRIFGTTVDSLRPHRLFPLIDQKLVGLKCVNPDGTTRWSVEREAQHPRGAWTILAPFHFKAHDGKGVGSFAQVVVDLDRTEVALFLDPATPFKPEATLELQWRDDLVFQAKKLELQRDGKRTLVRDPEQPGELFAVDAKLGELLGLDLDLFRHRAIFGAKRDEFLNRVNHWKFVAPNGATMELRKPGGQINVEPVAGTPAELSPKLQSAAATLYGESCNGFVHARDVKGDPFAKPLFTLTLGTADGDETLTVGDEGPDGQYCKLVPRLPEDLWMMIPRARLEELLRLALN